MNTITFIKIAFSTFIISIVIDYLWIGFLMHKFYDTELGSIGRRLNGALNANIPSVIIVYILLAIGITFFVMPLVANTSLLNTALIGALFGLVLYGIYDFTNYAVIANYSLKLLIVDIIWGTFLCGGVTVIIKSLITKLFEN